MAKLKCVAHDRRVHVFCDRQGALTVHREDGSRCVVNPVLYIGGRRCTPTQVIIWNGYQYLRVTVNSIDSYLDRWIDNKLLEYSLDEEERME